MPSTDIVRAIRTHIQKQLIPNVPKHWAHQFKFGLEAYGLRAFTSLTGNARMVGAKPKTAIRKCERLFSNTKLTNDLGAIFDCLNLVRPSSFVNIDHSEMNRLMALVGAIQTRKGRAVPCLVEATYSDRLPGEGSLKSTPRTNSLRRARAEARRAQSFTGHYIDALQDFHDRLGFWPRLVFDRGFGNESLVTHLQAEGATFYIRLKAGRFVEFDGQRLEIKQLEEKDTFVQLFGCKLRIIRSAKNRRASEPWYILTNDFSSSHPKIVKIYYHRFEIEETFRDIKHIWGLKRTRLNKPNSLKLILWLVSFGIALLHLVTKPIKQSNPKKQTSWLRQAYEQLQQAFGLLLWGHG
jgi:Transposase DDE domain